MTAWRKFKSLLLPLVLAVLCAGLLTAAKADTSLPSASNQGESNLSLLTYLGATEKQGCQLKLWLYLATLEKSSTETPSYMRCFPGVSDIREFIH
ncbi:mCG142412 [Mus musculus]|nr:mCG142412 [Mus musculus]